MRTFIAALLLMAPTAALAQTPAPAPVTPRAAPEQVQIPRELTDPAMADRLTDMLKAMSKAFLNLPVGQVEAAADGRQPTAADRRKTVRSETRMSERELNRRIEAARPMMRGAMQAMATALPAMIQGMKQAGEAMERAAANMPDPTYPKR